MPAEALTTDGKPGVKASYSEMKRVDLFDPTKKPAALATRVEPVIDAAAQQLPSEVAEKRGALIHWDGMLTARKPATTTSACRPTGSSV